MDQSGLRAVAIGLSIGAAAAMFSSVYFEGYATVLIGLALSFLLVAFVYFAAYAVEVLSENWPETPQSPTEREA